jgi:hypothetical protein
MSGYQQNPEEEQVQYAYLKQSNYLNNLKLFDLLKYL